MIRQKIEKQTGIIVLDRPEKRNALSREVIGSLIEAVKDFNADGRVKCIVLKTEGPVFCAGADLKELGSREEKGINLYADVVTSILMSEKPVIARVQGPAVGGGVGLVAACHLAAGSHAATFITPELKSGLFPLMVFSLIYERAGSKLAFELALCSKTLTAPEAAAAGLLNTVVEPEKLDSVIDAWTTEIGKWDANPVALGLGTLMDIRSQRILRDVRICQQTIDAIVTKRGGNK
ncbi:MAG: enoyl-CoA hydratase/isomerase family protein [Pseudomonadota bacterium]